MSAAPEVIRLLDYSKEYGHSVLLNLTADGRLGSAEGQKHDWGLRRHIQISDMNVALMSALGCRRLWPELVESEHSAVCSRMIVQFRSGRAGGVWE